MTPAQRNFFRDNGYLYLKRYLGKRQVDPIKRHVLSELKRLRMAAGGRAQSGLSGVPIFQQITKLGQLIKLDGLQQLILTEEIRGAITALAGTQLVCAQDAQLLLSLPHQDDWRLHGLNWHTDIAGTPTAHPPGIQVFALIDDVRPHGGGTLAIAGSHRLTNKGFASGKNVRQLLNEAADIEDSLNEMGLSILEMAGHAGDVYLMDMRLLHTPSINSTKSPRLMATVRYHAPR